MALSEIISRYFGRFFKSSEQLTLVRRQVDGLQKDLIRARRAIRSEWKTEVLSGRASPSIVRGVDRLPFLTCRRIYRKSSTVRACVDAIVREVCNLPWDIRPKADSQASPEEINRQRKIARDFFDNPNFDQESFRQLLTKFVEDLLVLDAGVIEKVWSIDKTKLLEIVARDGAEYVPIVDNLGYLLGYEQRPEIMIGNIIPFSRDEIIYLMLFPQTDSIFGLPIIESIVNEVATLLYAIDFIGTSFTEDEIPPGILNLGSIGKEAYERFKDDVREKRGTKKERMLRVIYGTDKVQWVDLKRANREMQTAELLTRIERIVYRNFGITPVEMGQTEKVPRASAEVQLQVSEDRMMSPVMNAINFAFNQDVVPALGCPDVFFLLLPRDKKEDDERESRAAQNYKEAGIASADEVRKRYLDLPPLPNGSGSRYYKVMQSGQIIYLDELPKFGQVIPNLLQVMNPASLNNFDEEESITVEIEQDLDEAIEEDENEDNRNIIPLVILDKMIADYEISLKEKWESVKNNALARGETKISPATIKSLSNLLYVRLKNIARSFYPKALDLGISSAEKAVGKDSILSKEERREILEEVYAVNEGYLKESLVKDLRNKFSEATKEENEEDPIAPVSKAFDDLTFRLALYAGALSGVAHEGFARVIFKQGGKIHWIDRKDTNECEDCIAMGAGSPYRSTAEMKFMPGWGVRCNGRCRCYLSALANT